MVEQFGDTAHGALTAVALIASLGIVLLAVEDLTTIRQFRDTGLMSWKISRLRAGWTRGRRTERILDAVLSWERFRALVVLRLLAGLAVVVMAALGRLHPAPILGILLALLALSIRSPYGLDGAHQMYLVIFGALFLASLATPDGVAARVATLFIGAQALLAYLVSGSSKAASAKWRRGDAVPGVMATRSYGHPALYAALRDRPVLARVACWWVIVFECGFLLAALAGPPYLEIALSSGLAFHAVAGLAMGLNGFFFAFVATYPCIAYLSLAYGDIA